MKKKLISAIVSAAIVSSTAAGLVPTSYAAEAVTPKYQPIARQMEKLNRGLIAVKTETNTINGITGGVYLSWRLLGTESLTNQMFDIYRNGTKIKTTGSHAATCYIDTAGTVNDTYKVVKSGTSAANEPETKVYPYNYFARTSEVTNGSSHPNSFTYMDVPIERPADEKAYNGDWSYYYNLDKDHEGGANDASVGDLDGDGEYEIVLKWDPTNSKDASSSGYSGHVYIDAYEIDANLKAENNANGHLYKWRIDLGQNIRAGAHDTQFLVYDFDGDGKSEIAMQTALGSKDGNGEFVTKVGDTAEIRNYTDEENNTTYERKGHNIGPDFYTVFDGETGAALCTTAGIPLGRVDGGDWGDSKMQRSHRFLAAVAYIDGVHPSIVMGRGYYNRSVVRAYTWDGVEMSLQWEHIGAEKGPESLYGQGNHNLSVADVDNDGNDEIVYGSAVLDDNGIAIGNTYLGHGDAIHVNDFNNDGIQEVFSVKEKPEGYKNNAADFRVAATGQNIWGKGASGDTGRGVMDNIDDAYAAANPNALSLAWSSSHSNVFDLQGNELQAKPAAAGSGSFDNFLVFWDGDLGRELLDANIIQKYDAANGWTKRFYGPDGGYTLTGGSTNNYTKRTPSLVADLWGDWREEVIMPTGKGKDETPALRIFTSTIPTTYRLTTLMHDSQYRMSVAWQNVAYNQPTHTSYYVGTAALAQKATGEVLNYLAPKTPFTKVVYELSNVPVTGITLDKDTISIAKNTTANLTATISPIDATKKSIIWTSDNENVATVKNGIVTGTGFGTTTITAETKDGGFKAQCTVNVYEIPVSSVSLNETNIILGIGYTQQLKATILPAEATYKTVKWVSSNETVATVDANGVVTGVGRGNAVISAVTVDGELQAKCAVNVRQLETTDLTGTDSFAVTGGDSNVTVNPSATGASINHNNSSAGVAVSKSFDISTPSTAKLQFKLTTGGQRIDGSNWNWTGHEYSLIMQMLDENGNNILKLVQPYAASAGAISTTVGSNAAKDLSTWKMLTDGIGSIQGSSKRIILTLDFDYAADSCTATIQGCDGNWAETGKYQTTFALNNAHFKTLSISTQNDGTGTIKASPSLAEVSYNETTFEANPIPPVEITDKGIQSKYYKDYVAYVNFENMQGTDVVVYAAEFDGEQLVDVNLTKQTLSAYNETVRVVNPKSKATNEIKIFAWDGNMCPIEEIKEPEKEEQIADHIELRGGSDSAIYGKSTSPFTAVLYDTVGYVIQDEIDWTWSCTGGATVKDGVVKIPSTAEVGSTVVLTVTATYNGVTVSTDKEITVTDLTGYGFISEYTVVKDFATDNVSDVSVGGNGMTATTAGSNYKGLYIRNSQSPNTGYWPYTADFKADNDKYYLFACAGGNNDSSVVTLKFAKPIAAGKSIAIKLAKPKATQKAGTDRTAANSALTVNVGSETIDLQNNFDFDTWKTETITSTTDVSEIVINLGAWAAAAIESISIDGGAIPEVTPGDEETSTVSKIKIMPLGDSITNGFSVPGAYRNELGNLLVANSLSDYVDFVGSQNTGSSYDNDNEGHSGWSIDTIAAADDVEGKGRSGITPQIDGWMATYTPDIVLLQIGTNDILSLSNLDTAGARLETLVDKVLAKLPTDGKLYIAKIPYIAENATYNKTGKTQTELDTIVDTYNTAVTNVAEKKGLTLVDINGCITLADLKDGIHPTADGYAKMGKLWYNTLESELKARVESLNK